MRFEVKGFGVDVIIIEPGIIRTNFGDTAVREIDAATPDSGPYAEFNQAVAVATAGVYESGPLAKLGGPPEAVARKIERAISARRPRARYTVTASARVLLTSHAALPDAGWDAMLRGQFPQPGKR
jgi:NAD(P)-dependent dehydrogenase (short-subunit alcohol dehydrogenase family)